MLYLSIVSILSYYEASVTERVVIIREESMVATSGMCILLNSH